MRITSFNFILTPFLQFLTLDFGFNSIPYFRTMILVTGGTGLVGSHLLYFLLKRNGKVRAIHRKGSDLTSVKKIFRIYSEEVDSLFDKIEWVEADITDIPALTEAFENIEHVYHCAAFVNFEAKKYKILKKANVEGTANIVNLCLSNNVKKLCYVSSVAVFGNPRNSGLITEETPWNPEENNSVYAITKYGAEIEVWRGTQEGLKTVIVNPAVIMGISPDGGSSDAVFKIGASGIPFYPTGGIGIVDVRDVVEAMITLMDSEVKNQNYILVGKNISYKQLISEIAGRMGKKPPKTKLSKRLLYLFSSFDWLFSKLFGTKRKLLRATIQSMFTESFYDASKIQNEFGFSFTPLRETLDRIVNYKLKNVAKENKQP